MRCDDIIISSMEILNQAILRMLAYSYNNTYICACISHKCNNHVNVPHMFEIIFGPKQILMISPCSEATSEGTNPVKGVITE